MMHSLFEKADKIMQAREHDYGDASDMLDSIAHMWTVVLGRGALSRTDVALCMACLKLCRIIYDKEHTDSYVDMLNYIRMAHDVSK